MQRSNSTATQVCIVFACTARLMAANNPPPWVGQPCPALSTLTLRLLTFVTSRRPSAAVALAGSSTPVGVLVVAPSAQRARAEALGAQHFAAFDDPRFTNLTRRWSRIYRHASPDRQGHRSFCYLRWLVLAEAIDGLGLPADAAVGVLEDDVLLFEDLRRRLATLGAHAVHGAATAETIINGAFAIASPCALRRYADFVLELYEKQPAALASIMWRYGERRSLSALTEVQRQRIDPSLTRGGAFPLFGDMDALNALRFMSRSNELPAARRVRWLAGVKPDDCVQVPNAIRHYTRMAALLNATAETVLLRTALVQWGRDGRPSEQQADGSLKPYCFVHLQGPEAKRLYLTRLLHGWLGKTWSSALPNANGSSVAVAAHRDGDGRRPGSRP